MTININQFKQTPVRGQLDEQISRSGVLSAQISANQATDMQAGDSVKLDPAGTVNVPQLLKAGPTDLAIGRLAFDVKKATFQAGDMCGVAGLIGPVMFLTGGATLAPGVAFQDDSSTPEKEVAVTSGKARGLVLDPASNGELSRFIILAPVAAVA